MVWKLEGNIPDRMEKSEGRSTGRGGPAFEGRLSRILRSASGPILSIPKGRRGGPSGQRLDEISSRFSVTEICNKSLLCHKLQIPPYGSATRRVVDSRNEQRRTPPSG